MRSETLTQMTQDKGHQLPQLTEPRNPGLALDLDWVHAQQANTSAIERRAASLPARRSVKKEHQAAWLLQAITCIDLTTLSGDDTRSARGAGSAPRPASRCAPDLLEALGMPAITTGAVCVYHEMVPAAVEALHGLAAFRSPPSPPGFRPGSRRCTCASPRSAKASRPGPQRSTS